MSTSKENEYFSDGITEEIINALAKIDGLRVTSRTSAFYFKGKNIPIPEIGKKLGVSTLLEGSVRLSDDTIRITAQLIDAQKDFHFWSETWDRKLDNIFAVQDEISLLIADRLREHLGHFEIQESLSIQSTTSVEAYKLFLKGRQNFNKWNPEDVKQSIQFYKEALLLDPDHAESIVGLAGAHSFLATIGMIPYEIGWEKCAELTHRALSINGKLPAAHYQLANLAFYFKGSYKEAFEHVSQALVLNPNHAESRRFLAFLYILAGAKEEARKHLKLALVVDPLAQESKFYSAYIGYMSEDYISSLQQLDECLQENPINIPAHSVKLFCLIKLARYHEALNYFNDLPSEIVLPVEDIGSKALSYALLPDTANAEKSLESLNELARSKDGHTASSYLFILAGATGKNEDAFDWAENAWKKRSPLLLLRYSDPLVNPLKNDSRYTEFHKKLFPEELFRTKKESGNSSPLLDEEASAYFKARLLQCMKTDKPYLNSDLSLRSLADLLELNANQASWLLNDGFGVNFNEFINQYRINAFMALAKDPKSANLTIMGIANDCGFNSKTVFNTYFKKLTGLTPSEFLNR